jgi:hypothetical protein
MHEQSISERLRRVAYEAHCLLSPRWMIDTIYEAADKLEQQPSGRPKGVMTQEP